MKQMEEKMKGLTIPAEVIETVGLGERITLSATEGVILLKKTNMTAIDCMNSMLALEELRNRFFHVLVSKFGIDEECSDCNFCKEYQKENVEVPDWALEEAGLALGTKLSICVEEGSERILLEPVEVEHDITEIEVPLLEALSKMGICLRKLNESVMGNQVIFSE